MLAVFLDDGKNEVMFSSNCILEAIRTSTAMLANNDVQKAARWFLNQ